MQKKRIVKMANLKGALWQWNNMAGGFHLKQAPQEQGQDN